MILFKLILHRVKTFIQDEYKQEMKPNAILVNLYRDGKDSIGLHCDKDALDHYIVSISLGQERTLYIRECLAKQPNQRKRKRHDEKEKQKLTVSKKLVHKILMQDGSVCIFKPGMQERFLHEIPKETQATKPRINLTIRVHKKYK